MTGPKRLSKSKLVGAQGDQQAVQQQQKMILKRFFKKYYTQNY